MAKKINCKHDLDKKQEIEARRVRVKLENGDTEVMQKYHHIWEQWFKAPSMSFDSYLRNSDVILYSAYVRECIAKGKNPVYSKIATYSN